MAADGVQVPTFDLTIEPEDDGAHLARVTAAPRGLGASTRFGLPPPVDPGARDPLASYGTQLFESIFGGEVGRAWWASLDAAAGRHQRLRLRFGGPAATGVPWERLFDPRLGLFLMHSQAVTLARFVDTAPSVGKPSANGPLRVCVAYASESPDDAETEQRWSALLERVHEQVPTGRIVLERLPELSRPALAAKLRQGDVHLLHVVEQGHGMSAAGLSDRDLADLVADHAPLRIVVLERRGPADDGEALTTAARAEALVRLACPAVVTIPTAMPDGSSVHFVRTLYASLAHGDPVDLAMSWARRAAQQSDPAEFTTPVLVVSARDARVFEDAPHATPGAASISPPPSYGVPSGYLGEDVPPPLPQPVSVPPPSWGGPPPPPAGSARTDSPTASVWRGLRRTVSRWLSSPSTSTTPPPSGAPQSSDPIRTAYPRLDVRSRRSPRPDVVVIHEPFDVTVGLAPFQDVDLAQTGGLRIATTLRTDLELVLTFDPSSVTTPDPSRLTLTVTDDDPFPSARVPFTALYRPDLSPVRRIGVQFLRNGKVIGIAWRRFVVVLHPDAIDEASAPPSEPNPLMDLGPLLGEDVPDLVLSVCASDGAATGEFVWTAWAASSEIVVPDTPRINALEDGLQQFAADLRTTVAYSKDPYATYLSVVGKAMKVGRGIPPGIATVVRRVVEDPARRQAAAVLLLTEELALPWELAVFDPPLESAWGGVSPFLGSHAAISRWPLAQQRPRPAPRSTVTVRRAAVLTADYAGVSGVDELDHALAEAQQVTGIFAPSVFAVSPSLPEVVMMLRGVPPADLVHIALHGRFDAIGTEEGLVLIATDDAGALPRTQQFLTPDQVETGRLDGGPFVFLNACQVASDKRVLGDYAGFASTLLRIGATGVVAPLWNVDDDVAAEFAAAFYAATWTAADGDGAPEPSSVAEAVRALRARYTEAAAKAHTPGVTATLVAFQVFGHPRLRLAHV